MNKALILAAIFAFSTAAFAGEGSQGDVKIAHARGAYGELVKAADEQCPAGTKLERGAQINIKADGSGDLVEHDTCEPLEDAAKDTTKAK